MRLKTNFALTIIGLLVLLIFYFFSFDKWTESVLKSNMCKAKEKAIKVKLDGIVVKKYRNKRDHMVETVEINSVDKHIKSTFLANEVSGFYDQISVGDSLIKDEESLKIQLINNGVSRMFLLDYMCKD